MFYQTTGNILVETNGPKLIEITERVIHWLQNRECYEGILNTYIMHTSASLIIQENADPSVQLDLIEFFNNTVPESRAYKHKFEGQDDMPAHIKSSLTNTSLSLSIQSGSLLLGEWQAIYLFEHRKVAQSRKINLHFIGTKKV
tara:strand:+ start:731 stop:1159 length:429 start_codon:yes stop_codon:yes gene_type:complete